MGGGPRRDDPTFPQLDLWSRMNRTGTVVCIMLMGGCLVACVKRKKFNFTQ